MPAGAVFIVFGIVLRMTEGVGWAMVKTTSLALLPYLFPSNIGMLTVSLYEVATSCYQQYRDCFWVVKVSDLPSVHLLAVF